jgi:hypothetical protein
MQALAFGAAIGGALKKLNVEEMLLFFHTFFSDRAASTVVSAHDRAELADLLFRFQNGMVSLSAEERRAAEILGLSRVGGPAELANLAVMLGNSSSHAHFAQNPDVIRVRLILDTARETGYDFQQAVVESKLRPTEKGDSLLDVSVLDFDGSGVEAARLCSVLQNLQNLYLSTAEFLNIDVRPLRIAFLDSGSDLRVGIEGFAGVITAMSEIFARTWAALRYRRNDDFERNVSSALKGVELLGAVRREAASGSLDPETAQRLETAVKRSICALIDAGALTEETDRASHTDSRTLLANAREKRLLSSGSTSEEAAPQDDA